MKKQRLIFLAVPFFCSLAVTVHAGSAQSRRPRLNMVVFDQQSAEQTPQPEAINQLDSDKPMQMVIFNQDMPTQGATTSEAASPQSVSREETTSDADNIAVKSHLKAGYQRNNLNWNIANTNNNPNVLSELQWKNIASAMIETGITVTYADNWHFEANLGYGYTMNGTNQDSDYLLNNRQGEFSRSYSVSDQGSIFDFSGAVGYHFNLGNKSTFVYQLTPKIGFSYHTQQFGDSHGVQVIPAYGNFGNGGLNKTYDASWYGAWAGLDAKVLMTERVSLQSSIAYHLAKYEGVGNWMLRSDFQHPVSFRHSANGDGIVASAGMGYLLDADWTLHLSADYQRWKARSNGIDTTYFSGGFVGETKLNEVNWNSYGINLGVEYNF